MAVVTPFCDDGVMSLAPGDLAVVMGMEIDKARRDQLAFGVDLLKALGRDPADLDDAAAGNRHVRFKQLAARTVGDGAAADHEVWIAGHDVSSRID